MMELNFTLNGALRTVICKAGDNAQRVLFNQCRMHSVRNSDDGFGFAGSDAILFNGKVINASLLIAAQLDGSDVRTAESLRQLEPAQSGTAGNGGRGRGAVRLQRSGRRAHRHRPA